MVQKSIYLRETEEQWLAEESDERNRSESWIIRNIIRSQMADPDGGDGNDQ